MLNTYKNGQAVEVCIHCSSLCSSSVSSEQMQPNYNVNDRPTSRTRLSVLPMFLLTLVAFVCLVLVTFSLPLVHSMYFLWSSQAGGVRFGIWGWCLDEGPICAETLGMGYFWDPEVSISIAKALILYPLAAIVVFLALIAFIPILRNRNPRTLRIFAVFAWSSFIFALVAFVFMIVTWSIIEEKLKAAGWEVRWGPLPWISFVSVLSLIIVAVNTWKGTLSSSYHVAPQGSLSGMEPKLERDSEKAIVSSGLSTPTSISAPPVTIATPRPPHTSITMKEGDDSGPVGRDRCQCKKGLQISQDGLSSIRSQSSSGTEGNSPVLNYPRLPPAALPRNTQKEYRIQLVPKLDNK